MSEANTTVRRLLDFGSTPPSLRIQAPHLSNYRRVYSKREKAVDSSREMKQSVQDYMDTYDGLNTSDVVIKARDLETSFGVKLSNEDIAAFCQRHGPRFIGFAGVD